MGAWVDPKQAAKWWGPRGFTITTHSKDFRSGGVWHYTMHGPDGTDYVNKTVYLEIEEYKKMVYDHGGNDERAPLFRVTVLFSEKNGRTTMDMTMTLATPEAAQEAKKFIKHANGNSTWDRLGEYLQKESTGREKFIINRAFEAPLETVFEMWANPNHLAKWLPPTGATMEILKADARPGGVVTYVMTNEAGRFFGRMEYKEIQKPSRLVYAQQFTDENGNVTRPSFLPVWPKTMMTIVELASEDSNLTRVTVTWEPGVEASPAEIEAFVNERTGMMGGWNGSFDKLEALLGKGS